MKGYTQPPVSVATEGGEVLTVDFLKKGKDIQDVVLEGEAPLVFEGKLESRGPS
jgi:diaminopimelate epimerase